MNKLINLANQKIGKWFVIEKVKAPEKYKNKKGAYWLCQCECGIKKIIRGSSLIYGNPICPKCYKKVSNNKLKYGEAAFNKCFRDYQCRARRRNIIFKLDKEFFKIITQQKCYYCNCEPYQECQTSRCQNGNYIYNGIDRIDPLKGYIIDNVLPCCGKCNMAKSSMSQEEFLLLIKNIYNNLIKKE
jgi:hypothetical protein